jgi:Uma2 family endonuclease
MQLTGLSSTSFGHLTAEDIRRMQADGLIDEDDNFELIEGRIVPMGPKYHAHERLKSELGMALSSRFDYRFRDIVVSGHSNDRRA